MKEQSSSHLGQGLVRLLWGAAVRLGDIAEGEGHVLKGEVAVKRREERKITLTIRQWKNCDINKNKQETPGALRTLVSNSLIRKCANPTDTQTHTDTDEHKLYTHAHQKKPPKKQGFDWHARRTTDEMPCNSKHCTEMGISPSYGCMCDSSFSCVYPHLQTFFFCVCVCVCARARCARLTAPALSPHLGSPSLWCCCDPTSHS